VEEPGFASRLSAFPGSTRNLVTILKRQEPRWSSVTLRGSLPYFSYTHHRRLAEVRPQVLCAID